MEKLFGDLDRLSEYPYDFNLFSSFDPQGLATIDYVDERDNTKIGITGWQNLDNDTRWQLRQVGLMWRSTSTHHYRRRQDESRPCRYAIS